MPLWLLNIGLWIKGNPIQAFQLAAVAALSGLALFWYFDYTGTKRENASLKTRIEQAEANYSAATARIDEFVTAQAKFEDDLEALRQSSIAIRGQVREALNGLSTADIERDFQENPLEAERALRERLDALWGMFERATGGAPDPR